ncbi:MAG: TfoX/Sxy family DNA transformation protein [Magnetovibrio sp.]|nr:TfoX/Sxy family DNA transformation protein [Magnetovibrio sp.]
MKQQVKNIGPVSWRAFRRIGIYGAEALQRMGAALVYVLVEEKGRLLNEVDDLRESRSHLKG